MFLEKNIKNLIIVFCEGLELEDGRRQRHGGNHIFLLIPPKNKDLPPIFATGSSVHIGHGAGVVESGASNGNIFVGRGKQGLEIPSYPGVNCPNMNLKKVNQLN